MKFAALLCLLPLTTWAACSEQFPIGNTFTAYCSNHKSGNAVIVIHGVNRNADTYLSYLADLPGLVIAPEFRAAGPGMYWSGGWSSGNKSLDASRVSSFEVMDRMVEAFNAVAIVGHSAGGQFVTRYAAATAIRGLTFIVANPGSYLWMDATRPNAPINCPGFNDYKYGWDNPNAYMSRGLSAKYPKRDVIYLLGAADTEIDSNLDVGCEANSQGANRFERGMNFFQHLNEYFGRQVHRLVVIPGVGHSGSQMMSSAKAYIPARKAGCGAECHATEADRTDRADVLASDGTAAYQMRSRIRSH